MSAGQYEAIVARQRGLEGVDVGFECFGGGGREGGGLPLGVFLGCQRCSDVEQQVHSPQQCGVCGLRYGLGAVEQAEPGVEFVDGAVCFEAGVVFIDACSAHE